ncbi:hypothetical protein MKW94_000715 [Papaver nudicaule]|uniref:Myb-like domain-containing protein n=1 Tax=Papaver nudicaule TaxID=74823 RepID=A0AA41RTW7_PAPNU|nr:hypothetical protein [Papaver nudicaule]
MVLDCRKHRELRYCWKEIGLAFPYRTTHAVSQRGHTLFTRDESRTWTEDEKAFILQYVKIHGNDWKGLADILGKNRYHVHDTYRRIFRAGLKKGELFSFFPFFLLLLAYLSYFYNLLF